MTRIHCLTCFASLTAPDATTANELACTNNWLPVKIKDVDGWLCERCSKWIDDPISIWQERVPEEIIIKKRTI